MRYSVKSPLLTGVWPSTVTFRMQMAARYLSRMRVPRSPWRRTLTRRNRAQAYPHAKAIGRWRPFWPSITHSPSPVWTGLSPTEMRRRAKPKGRR